MSAQKGVTLMDRAVIILETTSVRACKAEARKRKLMESGAKFLPSPGRRETGELGGAVFAS